MAEQDRQDEGHTGRDRREDQKDLRGHSKPSKAFGVDVETLKPVSETLDIGATIEARTDDSGKPRATGKGIR